MIYCIRTDATHPDFQELVRQLDEELRVRNGEEHRFFAPFNKIDRIKHAVIAYEDETPVGCGAIKEFAPGTMEVKRMFVPMTLRGKGIASAVLYALEQWAVELSYEKCILETGRHLPEAVHLYQKNGYQVIPNYGQYAGVALSICFEKELNKI